MVFRPGNVPHNRTDTPERIRERFFQKIRIGKDDDCWIWLGETTVTGYGRMVICGKRKLSHRLSFEIHFGEIGDGMMICHRCDNPSCVNPNHLFQGSPKDNRVDCISKKRHAFGEMSPHAILTDETVREIKSAYYAGTLNQREAARRHGVSSGLIGHIVHGRAWKHL